MTGVSLSLSSCGCGLESAIRDDIVSGAKPLCALALPWTIECPLCAGTSPRCPSAAPGTVRPLDLTVSVTLAVGSRRRSSELPVLLSRLAASSLWSAVAALARRLPLSCGAELGTFDVPFDEIADSGAIPTLRDFALGGVLSVIDTDALWRAVPRSVALHHTKQWLISYNQWLRAEPTPRGVWIVWAELQRCLRKKGLPVEIVKHIGQHAGVLLE